MIILSTSTDKTLALAFIRQNWKTLRFRRPDGLIIGLVCRPDSSVDGVEDTWFYVIDNPDYECWHNPFDLEVIL